MEQRAHPGLVLGVASAGVLALHQVAYLLAHPDPVARAAAADGHQHLVPLAQVLVPLALAVLTWLLACRTTRRLEVVVGRRDLVIAHVGLFTVLEVGERAVHGGNGLAAFAEPAVWVGLALAPALALATSRLLDVADRLAPSALTLAVLAPPAAGATVIAVVPADAPEGRVERPRSRGPPFPD